MAISIDLAIGSVATSGGGGGGSVNTGVLQVSGGGALSGTLQTITDQSSNASPLQLSTTQVVVQYPTGIYNGGFALRGGDNSGAGIPSFLDFIPSTSALGYYHAIGFAYDNSNWLGFYRGSRTNPALAFGNNLIWTPNYNVAFGHTSASARLHVKGDGTNPIARFENLANSTALLIGSSSVPNRIWSSLASSATLDFYTGGAILTGQWGTGTGYSFSVANGLMQHSSGTSGLLNLSGIFSIASGTGVFRPLSIEYTVSTSGTYSGTTTGIFLNATESVTAGTHNLIDLGATVSSTYSSRLKMSGGSLATLTIGDPSFQKGQINIITDSLNYFLRIGPALSGNNQTIFIGDGNGAFEVQFNGVTTQYWDFQNNVTIGNRIAYGNRLSVVAKAANNAAVFYTSAIGEIATIGVGGGGTSRFLGAVRTDAINDYANGYTMIQYVSATQIRLGNDALRLNPTTLAATFNSAVDSATSFTAPLFSHPTRGSIRWYSGDGVMTLMNSTENGFNRLNLGGLTNAAPAIKRNGAAIDLGWRMIAVMQI